MHNWLCFGGKKKRDQKYLSFKAPTTNDHTSNNPVAVSNKYEQKASIKNDRKASSKHELKATSKNKLKATSKNELRGQVDSKGQPSSTDNAGHGQARVFNYSELATSTRNFHPDNFLGEGGFGSVYKGVLCGTDKVVAVKRLNPTGFQGEKEFLVEVLMLSLLRHPNLVHMIGYCAEGSQRLLVLEFMPMGSLEAHLHDIPPDREPLDWDTRMKIAEGAAKGVAYLHNEAKPSFIFRDLKPSNILLDNEFNAKLSDFGLAKFGPVGDSTHVSTRVMGTHGYCAPEYFKTGKLTVKSDTFSFGVVLLELISGRRAMGGRLSLVDWARPLLRDPKSYRYLADPRLKGNYSMSALHRAIEVASMCLREHASGRPTMQEVALAMNYLTSKKHERSRSISEGIPCDISLRESGVNIRPDFNREQAIAEAKLWGEQWREKRRQSEGARSEALSSWVTQVNKDL